MSSKHVEAPAWASLWWESIWHSLPALAGLTLLTTIMHAFHPDFGLAHQLVQRAAWGLYDIRAATRPDQAITDPFAVTLTMKPEDVWQAFVLKQQPAAETLNRLGYAWPIDRLRLARALKALGDAPLPRKDTVLALDVDVAPLESGGSPSCQAAASPQAEHEIEAMADAISALRHRFGTVIVVALPRDSCHERNVRREFFRQVNCTLGTDGLVPGMAPLYLASARLELDDRGQVSDYLGELTRPHDALPREFPSLGNLLRLADANPKQAALDVLESQCRAVTAAGDDPALTEERSGWVDDAEGYQREMIDWDVIADGDIVQSPLQLQSDAALFDPAALAAFGSKRIVIALDGGSLGDRHRTPAFPSVNGAVLHAAVAASAKREANAGAAVLADVVAGLLFLSSWSILDMKLRGGTRPPRIDWTRNAHHDATPARVPRPGARLRRGLLALLVFACCAAAVPCIAAYRFDLDMHHLRVMAGVAPWFTGTLGTATVLAGVVAACLVDGLAFRQRDDGVAIRMPWSKSWLRLLFPLMATVFVASTCLLFSLDSLVHPRRHHFHDVSLVLAGLLLHSYMEVAHLHATEHARHHTASELWRYIAPSRLRVRLRHSLQAIRTGPALSRMDAALHLLVWIVLVLSAILAACLQLH
jgi:hypothetical protein